MSLAAPAPHLFCDAMLASLARWLRAAGYDTALARSDASDRSVLEACRMEARTLITRDRHLASHAGATVTVLWLADSGLDAQAAHLASTLGIDWLRAPFTRCLLDNHPLNEATDAERATAPERARALPGPFRACPACGRLYWPGSHVRRMQARLIEWQASVESMRDA